LVAHEGRGRATEVGGREGEEISNLEALTLGDHGRKPNINKSI